MNHRKRPPTHPGGILKNYYLDPLSLTVSQAAEALGVSRKTLSKIVNARGSVTPDMALRLSRTFQTTPDLWHTARESKGWRHAQIIPFPQEHQLRPAA